MNLFGLIPLPRLKRPPARPARLLDRLLQNRRNPASRITFVGHIVANLSDEWHGLLHGIGPDDRIYRDRDNAYHGYGRKR